MAASNTDKFRKGTANFSTTLSSSIGSSDTTIPLSSTAGLPTDTAITLTIDATDANGTATPTKKEVVTGVVSGSNLVSVVRAVEGTAQAHSSGATVVDYITAKHWNDHIDGHISEHNQDGTHKNTIVELLAGTQTVTGDKTYSGNQTFNSGKLKATRPQITTSLDDANGNEVIKTPASTNAVNEITVTNGATGTAPQVSATGDDTNIALNLVPKGTGDVQFNGVNVATIRGETFRDFVASGGVIASVSGLTGSLSNVVCYIGGKRVTASSIANKAYTASKDTYVDIDNTGAITYTEVANNAASPSLAANSIRLGIVVTGASSISVINQGSPSATAPTVSSNVLTVCDSLGNRIYPTNPNGGLLGYRAITSSATSTSTTAAAVTGLSLPVANLPTTRPIRIIFAPGAGLSQNTNGQSAQASICLGSASNANILRAITNGVSASSGSAAPAPISADMSVIRFAASSSETFVGALSNNGGSGTVTLNCSSSNPGFIAVELV